MNTLPSKKFHERKTFATPTLIKINKRLFYYRKMLKTLEPKNNKELKRYSVLAKKYERDMKIRKLLNRAVSHLYD